MKTDSKQKWLEIGYDLPVFRTFLQHPLNILIINTNFLSLGVANHGLCLLEN